MSLSSYNLLSTPMALFAPTIAVCFGIAAVDSPVIISIVRAVRAPLFLMRSSFAIMFTPDTRHKLEIS